MTKRNPTPPNAVLVAIDMSKHRQEVLIERPEGGRRRRMTVMATKTDYDRLASDLADIGRPVVIGFEATGNYHRTLAHRLLSAGFELRLISSVAHHLGTAVMTITPDRNVGCRPVVADMSHEAPDVTGGFLARGRLAGAQQHLHRPTGGSVVNVDR